MSPTSLAPDAGRSQRPAFRGTAVTSLALSGPNARLGTAAGVLAYDGEDWRLQKESLPPIRALRVVDADETWAISERGLHAQLAPDAPWKWMLRSRGLTDLVVVPDRSGGRTRIVSHETDGVFRAGTLEGEWEPTSAGLTDTRVCALAVVSAPAGDRVLAGTPTGLYVSADSGRTWRREAGIAQLPVLSLASTSDGCTYALVEEDGLWRMDRGSKSWRRVLPSEKVASADFLAVAGDHVVVVGDDGTVCKLHPAAAPTPLPSVSGGTCLDLAAGPSGVLYAGTTAGLLRLDGERWVEETGLPAVGAAALVGSKDAEVYVVYSPGSHAAVGLRGRPKLSYPELPEPVIDAAVTADGCAWLLGPQKLYRWQDSSTTAVESPSGPLRRIFAVDRGLLAVTADNTLFLGSAGCRSWEALPPVPTGIHRLVSELTSLYAVCAVLDGDLWRSVVWRADINDCVWRPVVATGADVPSSIVTDGAGGALVATAGRVLHVAQSGQVSPRSIVGGEADDVGDVLDLAGDGITLTALTSRGIYASTDAGGTWSRLEEAPRAVAISAAADAVITLTSSFEVCELPLPRLWAQVAGLPNTRRTSGPRKF